ncbi:hypothetical protein BH20ACI3_BH20ACI3_04460 [soil metagenome]
MCRPLNTNTIDEAARNALIRVTACNGILEREEETCWLVWWPFATTLERADTLEATDLHTYAPPLYSTNRACCFF